MAKSVKIILSVAAFVAVWAFAAHHLPVAGPDWFLYRVVPMVVWFVYPLVILFVAVTVLRWCVQQWKA